MIALADKSRGELFTRYSESAEQTHHWLALKSSQIPCLSPFGQNERRAGQLPTANSSALLRSTTIIQPDRGKEFVWIQKRVFIFFLEISQLSLTNLLLLDFHPQKPFFEGSLLTRGNCPDHHKLERQSLKGRKSIFAEQWKFMKASLKAYNNMFFQHSNVHRIQGQTWPSSSRTPWRTWRVFLKIWLGFSYSSSAPCTAQCQHFIEIGRDRQFFPQGIIPKVESKQNSSQVTDWSHGSAVWQQECQ